MTQCSGRGLESKSKGKGHNKLSDHSVLLVGEYIWGYQSSDQAVAKLWRSRDDVDSVVDYPGSSLWHHANGSMWEICCFSKS